MQHELLLTFSSENIDILPNVIQLIDDGLRYAEYLSAPKTTFLMIIPKALPSFLCDLSS